MVLILVGHLLCGGLFEGWTLVVVKGCFEFRMKELNNEVNFCDGENSYVLYKYYVNRGVGYGDNLVIECDHFIYKSFRDDIFNFFNISLIRSI